MSSLQWSWISGITTSGCVITRSFRRACKCLSNSEAAANKKEKSMKRIRNNTFHWLWRGSTLYNLPTWTQLTHSVITVFLTASYWYLYFTKDRTYYAYIGRVKNVFCLPFQEKLGKLLFFKLRCTDWCAAKKMAKAYPISCIMNYKSPEYWSGILLYNC